MPRCFQLHPTDNVATLLDDAPPGPVQILNAPIPATLTLTEPIAAGHKVALRALPAGDPILKYAIPIGHATQPISPGQWVHLHNCASNFDQRSSTLDVHTGATTDTKYE